MSRTKTKQLAADAILAAMCAVLGYLALDFGSIKITFESVPILIGALLFGPVDGLAVGAIGTLIYQLTRYGVSVTTLLWILPYALCGFLAGLYAKRRAFELSQKQTVFIVVAVELMITLMNTGTLYLDSRIYGYYYPGIILGMLAVRLVLCVVKAAAYAYLLPLLLRALRRNALR